ncbi:MAG: hypothetical protein ABGZ37_03265 [Akkermansiaceae bacterium]
MSTLVRNCESTFPPNLDSRTILAVPHPTKQPTKHPTKQPNEKIRDKAVGKSIVYLERSYAEGERRYYIEANGPDNRVWKRTSGSEGRAIENLPTLPFLGLVDRGLLPLAPKHQVLYLDHAQDDLIFWPLALRFIWKLARGLASFHHHGCHLHHPSLL